MKKIVLLSLLVGLGLGQPGWCEDTPAEDNKHVELLQQSVKNLNEGKHEEYKASFDELSKLSESAILDKNFEHTLRKNLHKLEVEHKYTEAEKLTQSATELYDKVGGPQKVPHWLWRENMRLPVLQKNYAAGHDRSQAFVASRKSGGTLSPEDIREILELGELYESEGQVDMAERLFRMALGELKSSNANGTQLEARAHASLGNLLTKQGKKEDKTEAEKSLQQAKSIRSKSQESGEPADQSEPLPLSSTPDNTRLEQILDKDQK